MAAWPRGYGHLPLGRVTSVLDEAARRRGELTGPTWISARAQTEARGRRGRPWANPEGNFAAALVLPDPGDPARAALRSFVAALALHDALATLTGRPEALALKWPNDVLLNGGKIAGILLEGLSPSGLAIGIGVNLAAAPGTGQVEPEALAPVSLAGETGLAVTPEDFLETLAPAYAAREAQVFTYGFAPIRSAWLARAARIGQPLTARLPGETVTGTFRDVDEAGRLVLSTPHGTRRIAAGDIFF